MAAFTVRLLLWVDLLTSNTDQQTNAVHQKIPWLKSGAGQEVCSCCSRASNMKHVEVDTLNQSRNTEEQLEFMRDWSPETSVQCRDWQDWAAELEVMTSEQICVWSQTGDSFYN